MSGNSKNIERLARFVRENPGDSFSKFALALELLKIGEEQKALILFESIRKSDPDYLGTYYHLGKLYQQLGRREDAEHCFLAGMDLASQKEDHHTRSELTEALEQLREETHDD